MEDFCFEKFRYWICNDVSILKKRKRLHGFWGEVSHSSLDFIFVCWVGFQFESSFCSTNLDTIQDVRKLWHLFSCKGPSFGHFFLCKVLGSFHHCKAIICAKKFFSWFFIVQGCYWDEDKHLSSWWFFRCKKSIGSIFTSKWKYWDFVMFFEYWYVMILQSMRPLDSKFDRHDVQ